MKTIKNNKPLAEALSLTQPTREASLRRDPSVSQFWNSNRNLLENAWVEWEIENKGYLNGKSIIENKNLIINSDSAYQTGFSAKIDLLAEGGLVVETTSSRT